MRTQRGFNDQLKQVKYGIVTIKDTEIKLTEPTKTVVVDKPSTIEKEKD